MGPVNPTKRVYALYEVRWRILVGVSDFSYAIEQADSLEAEVRAGPSMWLRMAHRLYFGVQGHDPHSMQRPV